MAVRTQRGALPHIEWIDLGGDGTGVECAVLKKDNRGSIYYIKLADLDKIDLNRMHKIVKNRNANHFELWDLMSTITLGNGMNSLEYFHQLVKMITATGRKMKPQLGVAGFAPAPAPAPVPVQQAPVQQAPAPAPVQQVQETAPEPTPKKVAPKKKVVRRKTTRTTRAKKPLE